MKGEFHYLAALLNADKRKQESEERERNRNARELQAAVYPIQQKIIQTHMMLEEGVQVFEPSKAIETRAHNKRRHCHKWSRLNLARICAKGKIYWETKKYAEALMSDSQLRDDFLDSELVKHELELANEDNAEACIKALKKMAKAYAHKHNAILPQPKLSKTVSVSQPQPQPQSQPPPKTGTTRKTTTQTQTQTQRELLLMHQKTVKGQSQVGRNRAIDRLQFGTQVAVKPPHRTGWLESHRDSGRELVGIGHSHYVPAMESRNKRFGSTAVIARSSEPPSTRPRRNADNVRRLLTHFQQQRGGYQPKSRRANSTSYQRWDWDWETTGTGAISQQPRTEKKWQQLAKQYHRIKDVFGKSPSLSSESAWSEYTLPERKTYSRLPRMSGTRQPRQRDYPISNQEVLNSSRPIRYIQH